MKTFLVFGLGAATMYLLDPEQGARRRARLRAAIGGLSTKAGTGAPGISAHKKRQPASAAAIEGVV